MSAVEQNPLDRGIFVIELSDEQAHEIHRVVFRGMKPVGYDVDD